MDRLVRVLRAAVNGREGGDIGCNAPGRIINGQYGLLPSVPSQRHSVPLARAIILSRVLRALFSYPIQADPYDRRILGG